MWSILSPWWRPFSAWAVDDGAGGSNNSLPALRGWGSGTGFWPRTDRPPRWRSIVSLVVLMGASTISALSGVGRGIKWLSNINMGLSIALLALFAVLGGAGLYGLELLGVGLWDYITTLPQQSLQILESGRQRTGRDAQPVAARLDGVLLGVVDRLCALCRHVHRPHFARAHDPRIYLRGDDCALADVLCLDGAGGRHRNRA